MPYLGWCETWDGKQWSDHYAGTAAAITGRRRADDRRSGRLERPDDADRAASNTTRRIGWPNPPGAASAARPVLSADGCVGLSIVGCRCAGRRLGGGGGLRPDRAGAASRPFLQYFTALPASGAVAGGTLWAVAGDPGIDTGISRLRLPLHPAPVSFHRQRPNGVALACSAACHVAGDRPAHRRSAGAGTRGPRERAADGTA